MTLLSDVLQFKNNMTRNIHHGSAILIAVLLGSLLFGITAASVSRGLSATLRGAALEYNGLAALSGAESLVEDMVYRNLKGMNVSNTEDLTLNNVTVSANQESGSGTIVIDVMGVDNGSYKHVAVKLTEGNTVAFHYAVQSGQGGVTFKNNGIIYGNLYSNGQINGSSKNLITGDVVSTGNSGRIDDIHSNGDMRAHTIQNSTVDGDAYYTNISSTLVSGTLHPNSSDPVEADLPIRDSQIDEWKQAAEHGGVVNCSGTYTISSDKTIGPKKYTCNLRIRNNSTDIYLTGPIWVTGTITIDNNVKFHIDNSLNGQSVALIADKESDHYYGSTITVSNNSIYYGSGDGSYVMLVSMNNYGEITDDEYVKAIDMKNSATGDIILYAPHGNVELRNNSDLKEATAYKIIIDNNAVITYEEGLASALFSSGPSGGYSISSWQQQ